MPSALGPSTLSDALVIKTWPYSESSLIVQLLTPAYGTTRVLAKGVRRIKGRPSSAFDLMTLIRGKLRPSHDDGLGSLSSVQVSKTWMYLRNDLDRLALASVALDILSTVSSISNPEPYFFCEAISYLDLLETSESPGSLTACLLIRLLHHAGHPPRIAADLLATAANSPAVAFDFYEECFVELPMEVRASVRFMKIPTPLLIALAPALDGEPNLEDGVTVSSRYGTDLFRWLIRVWEDHLKQSFKSWEFLEKTMLNKIAKRNPKK